jgi:hypothetical protein
MQAGRLSFVSGTVSVQPVGLDDWQQADPNLPLGPGDRIFTDQDGRAEIQIGRTFVRIGPNTDVSLVDDGGSGLSIGVAQGDVHVHTLGVWAGEAVHVNTPSGSASLTQPAELQQPEPPQNHPPQQQPQPGGLTGQRMHKPATQPEEQPTNNPPARNNNAAPGNGSSPQPGAHPGNNQGDGNQHGGKPEDRKDDRKDDKPPDKSNDK